VSKLALYFTSFISHGGNNITIAASAILKVLAFLE
jgi:hypothetical protein